MYIITYNIDTHRVSVIMTTNDDFLTQIHVKTQAQQKVIRLDFNIPPQV